MQQKSPETAISAAESHLCDIFGEPSAPAAETRQRAVWVSSRLQFFVSPKDAWPEDICFSGFGPAIDGVYRRLSIHWLGWLNKRVRHVKAAFRHQAIEKLAEIVNEGINAGYIPESLDDPEMWPVSHPRNYATPELSHSSNLELDEEFLQCGIG